MSDDCIFCKILSKDIPSFAVFEDDDTFAFMDINPVHDGHVLVIPKEHSPDVFSVSDAAIAATARTASRVARAVRDVVQPDGMNLLQCNGEAAAQSVLHFHMHVLPRKNGDGASLNWPLNPGNMERIQELAERIRETIDTHET